MLEVWQKYAEEYTVSPRRLQTPDRARGHTARGVLPDSPGSSLQRHRAGQRRSRPTTTAPATLVLHPELYRTRTLLFILSVETATYAGKAQGGDPPKLVMDALGRIALHLKDNQATTQESAEALNVDCRCGYDRSQDQDRVWGKGVQQGLRTPAVSPPWSIWRTEPLRVLGNFRTLDILRQNSGALLWVFSSRAT